MPPSRGYERQINPKALMLKHDTERRARRGALVALTVGSLTAMGCTSQPLESLELSEQQFLLEVEYASSWFPTWTGISIDRDGMVTRYYREDTPFTPADRENLTLAELEAKYEAEASVVFEIDAQTVGELYTAIGRVGNDFSGPPNVVCADAGYLSYTAFVYDEVTERYRPLTLRREGDDVTQNTSLAGRVLAEWLREFLTDHPVEGVRPFQDVCVP